MTATMYKANYGGFKYWKFVRYHYMNDNISVTNYYIGSYYIRIEQ